MTSPPATAPVEPVLADGDPPPPRRPRRWPAAAAVGAIRVYQLSRAGHVSPCRFTPTCSQYAVDAIERHGLGRGLRLIASRLARCRPGGPFGADPVPD